MDTDFIREHPNYVEHMSNALLQDSLRVAKLLPAHLHNELKGLCMSLLNEVPATNFEPVMSDELFIWLIGPNLLDILGV